MTYKLQYDLQGKLNTYRTGVQNNIVQIAGVVRPVASIVVNYVVHSNFKWLSMADVFRVAAKNGKVDARAVFQITQQIDPRQIAVAVHSYKVMQLWIDRIHEKNGGKSFSAEGFEELDPLQASVFIAYYTGIRVQLTNTVNFNDLMEARYDDSGQIVHEFDNKRFAFWDNMFHLPAQEVVELRKLEVDSEQLKRKIEIWQEPVYNMNDSLEDIFKRNTSVTLKDIILFIRQVQCTSETRRRLNEAMKMISITFEETSLTSQQATFLVTRSIFDFPILPDQNTNLIYTLPLRKILSVTYQEIKDSIEQCLTAYAIANLVY